MEFIQVMEKLTSILEEIPLFSFFNELLKSSLSLLSKIKKMHRILNIVLVDEYARNNSDCGRLRHFISTGRSFNKIEIVAVGS